MTDRVIQYIAAATVGVLAVVLVGASCWGWLIGRELPQWLALADGAIITGAFGTGAFFAQARAAVPTNQHLADLTNRYHELAMAGMTASAPAFPQAIPAPGPGASAGTPTERPGNSGTTESTGGGE